MKREDVLKMFPDATEAQITGILNAHHKEVQAEKKTAEQLKGSAEENKLLQEQLEEERRKREEIENKGLSEAEKIQKQNSLLMKQFEDFKAASEKENAALKAQLAFSEIGAYAASKNLIGDSTANILKAFNGDVELAKAAIDSIVGLKTEWESAAALAKEQEIAKMSSNPNGNNLDAGGENKVATDMAIASAKRSNTANESILNAYRR